jgi:hypothetical protein
MKFLVVCDEFVDPVWAQVGLGEMDSLLLVGLCEPLRWDSCPTYQRFTLRPCEALHGLSHRGSANKSIGKAF